MVFILNCCCRDSVSCPVLWEWARKKTLPHRVAAGVASTALPQEKMVILYENIAIRRTVLNPSIGFRLAFFSAVFISTFQIVSL